MAKELTAKEALFCEYYKILHSAREAAARSGYPFPERSGIKLLKKAAVRRYLNEIDTKEVTAEDGLKRIAFGNVTDAVYLCTRGEMPDRETLETLDLYMVSEIKIPKGGGIEIKFFDRLKALDLLAAQSVADGGSAEPFFRALRDSAKSLTFGTEETNGI